METSRDDVGIVIRSAFLKKGAQQKLSLFALTIISIILIFAETIQTKPLDYLRSITKDIIYRGSVLISSPAVGVKIIGNSVKNHINLFNEYEELKRENTKLKEEAYDPNYIIYENTQLRKLLGDQNSSKQNLVSARVMIDKQSVYLNSFVINSGSNRKIKKGTAVLDGKNFIGRIVDVNFFSSRILLVTDLNSKIPVIILPTGDQAILSGRGTEQPLLDFLPENHGIQIGDKVYTSGKEGIFSPGIPIGEVEIDNSQFNVSLFSDISQILFVNINLGGFE